MTAEKVKKEKPASLTLHFHDVTISSLNGSHRDKHLPANTEVYVDKKVFHIGNFTTGWKDVKNFMFTADDNHSQGFSFLDDKDERVIECRSPRGDGRQWEAFQRFADKRWEKLEKKRGDELSRARANNNNGSSTAASKSKARRAPTKRYGRKQNTRLESTWGAGDSSDDDDGGDHGKMSWKRNKHNKNEPEVEPSEDLGLTDGEMEEDEAEEAEEAEEEEFGEDDGHQADEPPPAPIFNTKTPKQKGRKIGKRLRRVSMDMDLDAPLEDSDDEFKDDDDDADMTTPKEAQRVVTPFERQHNYKGEKDDAEMDDDDDDEETTPPPSDIANNTRIQSFFKPVARAASSRSMPSHGDASTRVSKSKSGSSPKSNATKVDLFGSPSSPRTTSASVGTATPELTPTSETKGTPKAPPTTASKSASGKRRWDEMDNKENEDEDVDTITGYGRSPPSQPNLDSPRSGGSPNQLSRRSIRHRSRRGLHTYSRPSRLGWPHHMRNNGFSPNNRFSPNYYRSPNNNTYQWSWRTSEHRSPAGWGKTEANDEDDNDCPYRGLRNAGNTCYLNSSLQMLFTVKEFVDSIDGKGGELTQSIVDTARDVADTSTTLAAASARSVKFAIDKKTDKFRGYQQRDAHEFLGDLIDNIHEELVEEDKKEQQEGKGQADESGEQATGASKDSEGPSDDDTKPAASNDENDASASSPASSDTKLSPATKTDYNETSDAAADEASTSTPSLQSAPSTEESEGNDLELKGGDTGSSAEPGPPKKFPTDDFFRCNIEVCLTCNHCGYSRTKRETYLHLSLDIESEKDASDDKPASVARSLDRFFQSEERELKCEKCSDGDTATQSLKLLNRPKALLLHLKRFIVEQRNGANGGIHINVRKSKTEVELSKQLSLDAFIGGNGDLPEDQSGMYSLKSLVHHVGNSASSGHYTAHALRKRPQGSTKDAETAAGADQEDCVFYDDSRTRVQDLDKIANNVFRKRNAYMLLYMLD